MRVLVCLLALTVVSAAEDDTSVADREKTGYDLSPPNDKNDAKVNPVLPCYLLGEADQIAAQTHTSAWLKPRNISKRCDHKRKPFPSLTQCYRYNTFACCVSGHDTKIKEDYSNLLSTTCLREYEQLEFYYCLGCHPEQGKFTKVYSDTECQKDGVKNWQSVCPHWGGPKLPGVVDRASYCTGECAAAQGCDETLGCDGHIRLCRNYVYKLLFPDCSQIQEKAACTETKANKCCYDDAAKQCKNGKQGPLSAGSTNVFTCKNPATANDPFVDPEAWAARNMYDGCGLNLPNNKDPSDSTYRLPSFWFQNATEFLRVIKPPYFNNFAVMVDEEKTIAEQGKIVGHTVGGVDSTCYTSGSAKISWSVSMLLVTLVAVAAFL